MPRAPDTIAEVFNKNAALPLHGVEIYDTQTFIESQLRRLNGLVFKARRNERDGEAWKVSIRSDRWQKGQGQMDKVKHKRN